MSDSEVSERPSGVRLDVWLWAARFFRTRALAKHAIETGKIELGGARGKAAKLVHAGDRLLIARGEERYEIDVLEPCSVRGSAAIAQRCYRETEESRTARARRSARAGRGAAAGGRDRERRDKGRSAASGGGGRGRRSWGTCASAPGSGRRRTRPSCCI